MSVQRGLLLIADIAGYTRFMEFHRTDLAHGQQRETLGVVLRALPYAVGLRKLGGLHNLTPA